MILSDWIKERRRIHDAATGGWECDEEDGGNFWTGGGRSDFHLTPDDARSAVDAHNTLPAALTMIEKVLEVHKETAHGECTTCVECVYDDGYEADFSPVEYPCPTVRAIEGPIK